jgi:NADH dehydrogenase (ubiquinone) flavoprotein 2
MALSERIKSTINGIRDQFPTEQALLLPLLHEIQEEYGWVSMESMKAAGEFLNLPLSKVREVTSFYTMYKLEPSGKVDVQICTNISCWLNGSDKLVSCAEKKLGIKSGETTKDGKFTLSQVECLASCGTAPVVQMNQDYYESISSDELINLLDQANKDLDQGKVVGKSTHKPGVWP